MPLNTWAKLAFKIKLSKCSFFKEQIHYLGHLVNSTSILPLTDKIEAVKKLKPPNNIKEVRHVLSLTGYYRKFICNYLDIAYPLYCLTCKSQLFIWIPDCQSSFNMLCSRLATTPIVQAPDPNKPYTYHLQMQVSFAIPAYLPKPPLVNQTKH